MEWLIGYWLNRIKISACLILRFEFAYVFKLKCTFTCKAVIRISPRGAGLLFIDVFPGSRIDSVL